MTSDNSGPHRYFNPPSEVRKLGRRLEFGSFAHLGSQLRRNEVLIGLYRNWVALVATLLDSAERMEEMNASCGPAQGYYALDSERANEGFDE
jgi:hypothetical protein